MAERGTTEVQVRRKPVPVRPLAQHDSIASALPEAAHLSSEFTALHGPGADNVLGLAKAASQATTTLLTHHENNHNPRIPKVPARRSRLKFTSWTDPLSLAMFCVLFVLVLATLILLLQLSRSRDGFNIPLNVSPYTWKYGPTAVITIIIAFWLQVDRQTKMNQPWIELSATNAPADKTLLLDYASPILPVALWTSLRNKHWRVAITITVFTFLKIAAAFSTSLFVVHTATRAISQVPLMLQSPHAGPAPTVSDTYYMNQVYGNIVNGLEYPSGISAHAAFQVLSTANQLPFDTTITAEVTAAFPDLLCEPISLTTNFTTSYVRVSGSSQNSSLTMLTAYFNSTHCYGSVDLDTSFDSTCNIRNGSGCISEVYYVTTERTMNCLAFQDRPNYENASNAFLFILLALSPPAQPNGSFLRWSSGALCRTNYVVEKATLTGNSNDIGSNIGFTLSEPLTSANETFPGYVSSNLTNEVANMAFVPFEEALSTPPSSSTANYGDVDGWFNLMLTDGGTADIKTLQEFPVLVASANRLYQRFAVYALARQPALSDSLNAQASYLTSEAKVFVIGSSVWIVMAITGIAIILTAALLLISARQKTVYSLSSLSELSSCVPWGSVVFRLLHGTGQMSIAQVSNRLSRHTFSTVLVSEQRVQLRARISSLKGSQKMNQKSHQTGPSKYWVPFSAWKSFTAVCIVVPAIEIIVLEILQRKSNAHHGFGDAHTSLQTSQTIAALTPAAMMLSTAALYSAAEWSVGVFTPFSLAAKSPVPLKKINKSSVDAMAPVAIFQTLVKRQYGATIIISSTILGSFLTIISSGLYSLQVVPRPLNVSLFTTTQFDTTWDQESNITASNLFSLIEFHNASYPAGTFEDLAFPLLKLNEVAGHVQTVINNATFVDVDVPVLRAHLNCTVLPQDKMSYGITNETASSATVTEVITIAQINATMDLPDECRYSRGIYENSSQLTMSSILQLPSPFIGSEEAAELLYVKGLNSDMLGDPTAGSLPPYCPSIAFAAGKFNNDTSIEDKTVLVCTQLRQEIPATLRFILPGLSLDFSTRPKLDENRAKVVSGYQYRFKSIFNDKAENAVTPSASLSDGFYQTVVNMSGISIETMINPNNEVLLYNQTENLYRLFMAQIFGTAMRVKDPPNGSVDATTHTTPTYTQLNGIVYDNGRMRVVQHSTSKTVLQVMLGVTMFCAGAAFFMVKTSATLYHNPCSVAGKLSLLVGGRIAEECADIAALCDDIEEPGRRLQDREVVFGWQESDRESSDLNSACWYGLDFHVMDTTVSSSIRDDQPLDQSVSHSDHDG